MGERVVPTGVGRDASTSGAQAQAPFEIGVIVQSPLGQNTPLGYVLETFIMICAAAPTTEAERLFVAGWNRAVGKIHNLEGEVQDLWEENRRLSSRRNRGLFGW
jgi:hypothetical protein